MAAEGRLSVAAQALGELVVSGQGTAAFAIDAIAAASAALSGEGTARFASPLSVADFVKRISLIALGADEGQRLSAPAALLADGEGLTAHAAAARARLQ